MSDSIPKPPIFIRLFYKIHRFLSPRVTLPYILVEVFAVVSMILTSVYVANQYNILMSTVGAFSVLTISLLFYSVTVNPHPRIRYIDDILPFPIHWYIIVASVPAVGLLLYRHRYESVSLTDIIIVSLIIIYAVITVLRVQKYLGDRKYYTDEHSPASSLWIRASIALEQSVDANRNEGYRSYYWGKRAEETYENIIEVEDRPMKRRAAGAFSVASQLVAVRAFQEGNQSVELFNASKKSIDQALELLSVRVCDSCGRTVSAENCFSYIDNEDRTVMCSDCKNRKEYQQKQKRRQQQKSSQTTDKSRSSNKTKRDATRTTNTTSNTSSSTTNNRDRQKTDNRMSVEDALDALHLDSIPDDTSEIHRAFRERVKEVHPDVGGSAEKFKTVKRARERIMDE